MQKPTEMESFFERWRVEHFASKANCPVFPKADYGIGLPQVRYVQMCCNLHNRFLNLAEWYLVLQVIPQI